MILNLNGFYNIIPKKRNSHGHLKCIKLHLKVVVLVLLCSALSILSYFTLTISNRFHCDKFSKQMTTRCIVDVCLPPCSQVSRNITMWWFLYQNLPRRNPPCCDLKCRATDATSFLIKMNCRIFEKVNSDLNCKKELNFLSVVSD